jgi:membrane-associated phospholipid phosphatase
MKHRIIALLLIVFILVNFRSQAQNDSSITKKRFIIPTILIGSGTVLTIPPASFKVTIRDFIQKNINGYRNHAEDYFQYAPILELYAADIFHMQPSNNAWGHTKCLLLSELGTAAITHLLKSSFDIERPDGSAKNSFPSGHTSQAFTAATVLYLEMKDSHPIYAYSGYVFATATGAFRMINNRHWLPDVLVGAGLGILVTNLVYYFHPLKSCCPRKTNSL